MAVACGCLPFVWAGVEVKAGATGEDAVAEFDCGKRERCRLGRCDRFDRPRDDLGSFLLLQRIYHKIGLKSCFLDGSCGEEQTNVRHGKADT
jgi:hypothetical protein